jgi:hypothetical protein
MVSLLVLPDCPIELPDCPLELCTDWVESCANAVIEADSTSAHASVKSFFMKFCSFFYFLRISEWRSFLLIPAELASGDFRRVKYDWKPISARRLLDVLRICDGRSAGS